MAFISIKYILTLCVLMENSTLTQYVYTENICVMCPAFVVQIF